MAAKTRIGKVTTRTGDRGTTKLATGRTVGKHEQAVRTIGAVDELNSHLGVLTGQVAAETEHADHLRSVQQALFDMGAVFAMEGEYPAPVVTDLEQWTQALNAALPPLTEFVLPGGGPAAAQSHVCRSVCRRAEVEVWTLIDTLEESGEALTGCARYLNRLSDYFFVLARTLTETPEQQWQGPRR